MCHICSFIVFCGQIHFCMFHLFIFFLFILLFGFLKHKRIRFLVMVYVMCRFHFIPYFFFSFICLFSAMATPTPKSEILFQCDGIFISNGFFSFSFPFSHFDKCNVMKNVSISVNETFEIQIIIIQ